MIHDTSFNTPGSLTGLDGRQIVDQLDRVPVAERDAGLVASVRAGEVLVSEAGSDDPVSVPLPGDEFYLSVAPYVDTTHDCFYHSLTTCHGELGGQDVHVTITDTAGGDVLVDEDTTTFDNGFVGYWLPAGIEATLTIEHNGLAVTAPVSTGPQDATCLTALQLT